MKKIILASILFLSFLGCKKESLTEDNGLPLPPPQHTKITGKNVLLCLFDGTTVAKNTEWSFSSPVNFLPSGLSSFDKKFVMDSMQREFIRTGINMLPTEDSILYKNATGIRTKMVFTATSYSVVTMHQGAVGVGIFNGLQYGVNVGAFVFMSRLKYIDGRGNIKYNLGHIVQTALHEFGHNGGLWHVLNNPQYWMCPGVSSTAHKFFGTSVVDEYGNLVNQQLIMSSSVPKRLSKPSQYIIVE
jgi:hypothetical protein